VPRKSSERTWIGALIFMLPLLAGCSDAQDGAVVDAIKVAKSLAELLRACPAFQNAAAGQPTVCTEAARVDAAGLKCATTHYAAGGPLKLCGPYVANTAVSAELSAMSQLKLSVAGFDYFALSAQIQPIESLDHRHASSEGTNVSCEATYRGRTDRIAFSFAAYSKSTFSLSAPDINSVTFAADVRASGGRIFPFTDKFCTEVDHGGDRKCGATATVVEVIPPTQPEVPQPQPYWAKTP